MGSILYKVCKRTIERELAKGILSEEFINDMMGKLDLYAAANKITLEEYNKLVTMLNANDKEE